MTELDHDRHVDRDVAALYLSSRRGANGSGPFGAVRLSAEKSDTAASWS
jgi:hypothetical protein